MTDQNRGTEGFGIMRAFSAVAVLVALYGFSLSAMALIDHPLEAQKAWFDSMRRPVVQRANPSGAIARGASFWNSTPRARTGLADTSTTPMSNATSFWRESPPESAADVSKLARDSGGRLDRM